jgi:autotransporter translocation and assembly factor TamB
LKTLVRVLLLVLVLLATALVIAPFTERGTRLLIASLHEYTPLDMRYGSGTLGSELSLEHVALDTGTLVIELQAVVARLDLACLWRSAFCFSYLAAETLDITVAPSREEVPGEVARASDETDSTLFVFPVDLEAQQLSIANTRVRWSGGEWRNGAAELGALIRGSTVAITDAVLAGPVLELTGEDDPGLPVDDLIALPRIDLPLILSVDELRLLRPAWSFYGSTAGLQELLLAGEWRNTKLHLERFDALSSEWGEGSLQGDIDFSDNWPLHVDSVLKVAQPPLWQGLHGRDVSLQARGSLAQMQLHLVTQGEPAISARAQLSAIDRNLPFQAGIDVDWPQAFALGKVEGMPEPVGELVLEGSWHATLSGSRVQQSLAFEAAVSGFGYKDLQLSVNAEHREGLIHFEEVHLQDASDFIDLSAQGEWQTGPEQRLVLSLVANLFALPAINDAVSGQLQGRLNLEAQLSGEQWQLLLSDVDISGDINELPASARGQLQVDQDWRLAGSDLQAAVNDAKLSLRGAALAQRSGEMTLSVPDLGRWQPGARGELQIQAQLDSSLQQLSYSATVQDLDWGGISAATGVLSGNHSLDTAATFSLSATVSELRARQLELSTITLAGSGGRQRQQFELDSQGDINGSLQLLGTMQGEQWRGTLQPATLQSPHGVWQLPEAVAMEWLGAKQQLAVANHCWSREEASICPGELLVGSQGTASIDASGDLRYLQTLLPRGFELQGQLELHLESAWEDGLDPIVRGTAGTRSIVVTRHYGDGDSASAQWESGTASLLYDSNGLAVQTALRREQRDVVFLDLLLPPASAMPLRGVVRLDRLRLAPFIAFLPMLSQLQGEWIGELQLQGSIDQPLAYGQLQLTDASLGLVGNPTALQKLQLSLELRGERVTIAGDGVLGGGPVRLQGELGLQPELSLELSVAGERQNILYPPATELLLSEQLKITAKPGLFSVSGDITVHQGTLEPEELPEGSVALSADVVEVDYRGKPISEQLPFDVAMDVRLLVEDKFTVRSSIMFATLGGELRLLQRRREPLQLFGSLKVVGGELRAYQQQLRIRRGTLSFSGRPDNPSVNVRAERNISGENVTVGIHVRGSYDALSLQVFSEPAMSQGEAMSYLVRGRGLDASTGEDGTAMALSLASGVVNRTTLVSELNRIPGVSDVSFGADGTADDTAATVSGYLGERIYLSYGVGLYEPINVLIARLYLRTRLWLEVVSRLENSLDLYYAFDID